MTLFLGIFIGMIIGVILMALISINDYNKQMNYISVVEEKTKNKENTIDEIKNILKESDKNKELYYNTLVKIKRAVYLSSIQ